MRFVVYGAGAVGGVVGARLAIAGGDVRLVARGEHLRAIRERGLTLRTAEGDTRVDVRAADTVAELDLGPDTAVLLAVKGQQTQSAVDDLLRHAPPEVAVVSLQNGVANERLLQRSFETVLGVCVMLPSSHLEPGLVIQASHPTPGMLDVGRYPGGADESCEEYAEAVRAAGFECHVRPDVMAWKHRKLIMNLGNAVQACCRPGEDADSLSGRARDEGEHVLEVGGIDVVTDEADRELRADLLDTSAMSERGGGSTWQSLRRGAGAVESDYLNGEISLLGRLHDVPTPVNDLLRRTSNRLAREGGEPASLEAAELLAELGV